MDFSESQCVQVSLFGEMRIPVKFIEQDKDVAPCSLTP